MSFWYDIQCLSIIALPENCFSSIEEHDFDGVRKGMLLFVGEAREQGDFLNSL